MVRSWLADGVVRFVGEQVVAIVTETHAQGVDAAELVFIDYDPLPVLVDVNEVGEGRDVGVPGGGHEHRAGCGGAVA